MIKVSVILPVYNTEKYLPQCLESIVNQTLKEIEIICIDDGSTDRSAAIIEEFIKNDDRIILLKQRNKGAGAARNSGIKIAKGKYLSFLDSDDFFDKDMLKKSYEKCEEDQADFCVYRSSRFDNKTAQYETIPWTIKTRYLPDFMPFSAADIDKYVFQIFNGWAWDKLYSKEFVFKNSLKFQEIRTTNDAFFVFMANILANRISIIDDILAYHRVNTGTSLSVTREKSWDCCYLAMDAIKNELRKGLESEGVKQSYINWVVHFSLWNVRTLTGTAKENLIEKLNNQYFEEFDVVNKPKEYFYDQNEYKQYLNLRKNNIRANVDENIFMKACKFYKYCGFKATMKKVYEKLIK